MNDEQKIDLSQEDDVDGHRYVYQRNPETEEEDVEGHRFNAATRRISAGSRATDEQEDDVEGHGLHKGHRATDNDVEDDVEGHGYVRN